MTFMTNLRKFKVDDKLWEVLRFKDKYPYKKDSDFIKKHKLEKLDLPRLYSDIAISSDSFDVAIMFSGGIDSLSLALRHLEKGESVALLSLAFNKDELVAASLTVDILKSLFENKVKIFYLFSECEWYFTGVESTLGLVQQPFAAFIATFMPDIVRKTAKTLEIAYCMNDDAVSFLTELKNIYNNAFKCKELLDNNNFPKIAFPLTKTKHYENLWYIDGFETKHRIIFPTFSSETCGTSLYRKNNSSVYIICTDNYKPTTKENKECPFKGYIVNIKPMPSEQEAK